MYMLLRNGKLFKLRSALSIFRLRSRQCWFSTIRKTHRIAQTSSRILSHIFITEIQLITPIFCIFTPFSENSIFTRKHTADTGEKNEMFEVENCDRLEGDWSDIAFYTWIIIFLLSVLAFLWHFTILLVNVYTERYGCFAKDQNNWLGYASNTRLTFHNNYVYFFLSHRPFWHSFTRPSSSSPDRKSVV
mgnify:CR=1 FL=1